MKRRLAKRTVADTTRGDAEVATTTYRVQGMSCEHCVRAVQTEVSAIDGVTAVDVDLVTGRVTVTADGPVDPAVVRAAVEEAGYEVTP